MERKLLTKLPTTGRLSSRMSASDKAKLEQRLAVYALRPEDFAQYQTIELEIGMGNGLALLERAKQAPDSLFIGNEIFLNGLRSLVFALEQNPAIKNVRMVHQDARELLQTLPEYSVHKLLVPYPDPWQKAKHNKRRLIQPDFLTAVQRVLTPNGQFWFISDIPEYIDWTLEKVTQHGGFVIPAQAGIQSNIAPTWWVTTKAPDWWQTTKYEQKAYREGRTGCYLCFVNNKT